MKKILLTLLFSITFILQSFAQGFFEHTVNAGESIASIVQKYEVSPYEIYELNPDAKQGLTPGMILVFLKNSSYPFDAKLIDIKKYKVSKGEKIEDIAHNNKIDVATLKKYNPKLYAESIHKDYKLKIPVFSDTIGAATATDTVEVVSVSTTTNAVNHQVLPKETKYGIAKQYDLSIAKLEALNPEIIDGLKIGQILVISKEKQTIVTTENDAVVVSKYAYHTVKPKEGFYRLTKTLGISQEELMELNPELKNGIQLGMLIKYPKPEKRKTQREHYNLLDSISNTSVQHISFVLPLRLHQYTKNDSTFNLKKLIKRDKIMNIALDFYSGAQMAIDSLKQLGIQTTVKVLDTEYDTDKKANVRRITKIATSEFHENEIVIGPIFPANVVPLVNGLTDKGITVFSPFSFQSKFQSANLCTTTPTAAYQRDAMISYLEADSIDKNVIIIADTTATQIKNQLAAKFTSAKFIVPREDKNGLLIPKDFNGVLVEGKENLVIVETKKMGLVATVVSILDTKLGKFKIKVATTSSQKQFDNKGIANRYKTKLNYHFPSVYKAKVFQSDNNFAAKYKTIYGQMPNRYALRGFDLTFDTVLRQANKETLTQALSEIGETNYIQNKFNYIQNTTGGYANEAIYILRYTPDFTLEEVVLKETINEEDSNLVRPEKIVPELNQK